MNTSKQSIKLLETLAANYYGFAIHPEIPMNRLAVILDNLRDIANELLARWKSSDSPRTMLRLSNIRSLLLTHIDTVSMLLRNMEDAAHVKRMTCPQDVLQCVMSYLMDRIDDAAKARRAVVLYSTEWYYAYADAHSICEDTQALFSQSDDEPADVILVGAAMYERLGLALPVDNPIHHWDSKRDEPGHGIGSDCLECAKYVCEQGSDELVKQHNDARSVSSIVRPIHALTLPNGTNLHPFASYDAYTPEVLLNIMQLAQAIMWDSSTELEKRLGIEFECTNDFAGCSIADIEGMAI